MSLLKRIELNGLTPVSLWNALDAPTREASARAVYAGGTGSSKSEADMLIAQAMRFRPAVVKQLPVERRVGYLLKSVPVDDGFASTMLMALHLGARAALLETFLDALGIPNDGGLIDENWDLRPPSAEALRGAIDAAYESFDRDEVDLYLAALVALDPQTWDGIGPALAARG